MNDSINLLHKETLSLGFLKVHQYRLKHKLLSGAWSREMLRQVVDRGNSVAVLAVDIQEELVVLTRQFRIGA